MDRMDLQHQVALKQRALDVVLAIDQVRDRMTKPSAIFSGVAQAVADHFDASACRLYLLDRETDQLLLKVVQEDDRAWASYSTAISPEVAQRAMQGEDVRVWEAEVGVYLAAVPIYMHEAPLGVLLLGRFGRPFDADDVDLLRTAESQIDSAIIQAYAARELALRNKELETIYRVDHIRDQNLPFDEMLDVVLVELCAVIQAEVGFVMLYNPDGERLEMRAISDWDFLQEAAYYDRLNRLAYQAVERGELICHKEEGRYHCAVMCVPLILRDEIIGVFGAVNRDAQRGFGAEKRRLLMAIVSQMDTAILESLERRQLRRVLGRSIDGRVLERLLEHPNVDLLRGERTVLSVLYADLRGSTALAARLDPELMVEFINDYLSNMTELLISHQGTLDKFVGDEVMALFGAPLPQPDHAVRAVRVGLAMLDAHQDVVARWQARGIEPAGLGVGIATGEVVVGEIGCERRTDYTIIGHAANLGARICSAARAGEVLICQDTYDLVRDVVEAEPRPGMAFKGLEHPVTVYRVIQLFAR